MQLLPKISSLYLLFALGYEHLFDGFVAFALFIISCLLFIVSLLFRKDLRAQGLCLLAGVILALMGCFFLAR